MGLPERWVDHQLATASGDCMRRVRALRFSRNLVLAAAALGLLLAVTNLVRSSGASARFFWATFGAGWVVIGYTALRQRLYLNRWQQR
jgi:hypothetical protein